MSQEAITIAEKEEIRKLFGKELEEMTWEDFQKLHRQLRAKYHPDNFEKFEDETVREMATERFQMIERLAGKVEKYIKGEAKPLSIEEKIARRDAQFAFDGMKIEVLTRDKDLKYHLFGTQYRWLVWGDKFKVPGSGAHIIMDEDHRGVSIGYRESIRMYLTFGVSDAVEDIVDWLYERIHNRADSLIIEGKVIPIERSEMLRMIKKTSFLSIGAGG